MDSEPKEPPPRVLPPGIPPGVRPRRPLWLGLLRPRVWLPLLGIVFIIVGLWTTIRTNQRLAAERELAESAYPVVVIDPGHGGHDKGANRNGLIEKDLALDTALRLEKHLKQLGWRTVLTRRDDRFIELADRAKVANELPRALFVSLHYNDNTTQSGDGVETFYATEKVISSRGLGGIFKAKPEPPPADNGLAFAQAVQSALVTRLGVTDRGAKPRQFAVVRYTRCPAVLVEGGFINNPAEARKLAQPAYRERVAAAVAEGIVAYVKAMRR